MDSAFFSAGFEEWKSWILGNFTGAKREVMSMNVLQKFRPFFPTK